MLIASLVLPVLAFQAGKLEIKDTVVGTGLEARVGDVVSVDYTGKLTSGKQFDSSIGREPFTFQLGAGSVIKGWDQGVVGMKEGGSRTLTIPSELGYGAQGAGSDIPPNSTLVFDVKLIRIEPRVKIETLVKGKGPAAQMGDTVSLQYKGTLKDGKEFDSSAKHGGQPLTFPLGGRMIPGFTQGLLGVQEGEKRRITIPAALGYGKRQIPAQDQGDVKAGSIIPANSDLVFEVDVTKVQPQGAEK